MTAACAQGAAESIGAAVLGLGAFGLIGFIIWLVFR